MQSHVDCTYTKASPRLSTLALLLLVLRYSCGDDAGDSGGSCLCDCCACCAVTDSLPGGSAWSTAASVESWMRASASGAAAWTTGPLCESVGPIRAGGTAGKREGASMKLVMAPLTPAPAAATLPGTKRPTGARAAASSAVPPSEELLL